MIAHIFYFITYPLTLCSFFVNPFAPLPLGNEDAQHTVPTVIAEAGAL
ncbi:MAG TPA: hypothetical protein VNK49_10835 [Anaerolineales bacterium]|nr:hypothetical protein [Anaerolineales bacterium]